MMSKTSTDTPMEAFTEFVSGEVLSSTKTQYRQRRHELDHDA